MCPLPVCPAPATSRAHTLTAEPSKAASELGWAGGRWAAEAWERGGGEVGGEVIRDRIQRGDRPQTGRASVLSTSPSLLSDLHKTQPVFWGFWVSLMQTSLPLAFLSAGDPGQSPSGSSSRKLMGPKCLFNRPRHHICLLWIPFQAHRVLS